MDLPSPTSTRGASATAPQQQQLQKNVNRKWVKSSVADPNQDLSRPFCYKNVNSLNNFINFQVHGQICP
jgi:hypothetical protein